MSAIRPARQKPREASPATQQERLQTVLQDLEGVERLQQMQWRLLREVIREVNKLRRD